MANILEDSDSLSPEDRFLLELLVDGELDEPRRRDLLLKLDRVAGGWRCCAAAFLESQCVKESLSDLAAGERRTIELDDLGDRLAQTLAVSVKDIPDRAVCVAVSDSNASADDPLIIPMKRSGYSRGAWSRRLDSWPVGTARTRLGYFGAVAGGFLLAVVMTGALGALYWGTNAQAPRPTSIVSTEPIPAENSFALHEAPAVKTFAKSAVVPASPLTNASVPIHHVTLKSSSNDLDGISVPCVESDCYDPAAFGDTSTDDYAERLRQDGHRVETVSEQLMFNLDDGRVLIVPVDTINVRYKEEPTKVIYQ